MNEKKVVRRTATVALGVLCIILLAGTVGAVSYYNNIINEKNNAYSSYVSNHSYSNADVNVLNSTYQDYASNHSHSNSEFNTVQSDYNIYENSHGYSDSDYDTLSSNYQDYKSAHSHSNTDYDAVNSQLASANAEKSNLQTWLNGNATALANANAIVNLQVSTIWVNSQTVGQDSGGFGISYYYWTFSASYAGYIVVNVHSSTTTSTAIQVIYNAYGVNYNTQFTNIGTSGVRVFPVLPTSNIQIGVGNGNLLPGGATETVTITYYY
jgi:hypothetical protein